LVPSDDGKGTDPVVGNATIHSEFSEGDNKCNTNCNLRHNDQHQNHGDDTGGEKALPQQEQQQQQQVPNQVPQCHVSRSVSTSSVHVGAPASSPSSHPQPQHDAQSMGKSPGEVAFFKLLHAEFKKATHFFDRATEEFAIREERVREGVEIMKQPNSIMVNEKWGLLAKSIYRLFKDLLLLETFAIMTYCSFSKILKKHDKVTGYETRKAFMENVVNKANFTHYPKVLDMISRCERWYEEVSENLLQEGKQGLYEDERTCNVDVMSCHVVVC
jgi:hypothetical protein